MNTAQTAKVSILGTEYTLRGDTAEERISEVGKFVDDKMRQAQSTSGQPHDIAQIAILTSLNIAYELFSTRANAQEELSGLRERAAELADQLESCISEGNAVPSSHSNTVP